MVKLSAAKMSSIVALDVGTVRVGVARANSIARIAEPLHVLRRDEKFWDELNNVLKTEEAELVVLGLPRNLSGDDTVQTTHTRQFADEFAVRQQIPYVFQDEALTSHKAETELLKRKKAYSKAEIDALAACYILDDYLQEHSSEVR